MELETGVLHLNIPYEQYHAVEALRSGDLAYLMQSPAHLIAHRLANKPPSPAMELGKIFHIGIEEPLKLKELLVVEPTFVGKTKDGRDSERSAEARQKKAEWYASLRKDVIVLNQEEADRMVGMLNAINNHKLVSRLIRDGLRESSGFVEDPETGILLKFRPDLISEKKNYVVDFKTTRNASHQFFINQIFSSRGNSPFYILNGAHYAHCAKLTKGCNGDSFIIVAIESEAPFGINVFPLDSYCLEVGEKIRSRLTKLYAECSKSGIWPSYPESAAPVAIPGWVQWEDDL